MAGAMHPEHAWGHHIELPSVSDRDMRKFVQRIAGAIPLAAVAEDEASRTAVVNSVWPDLMECAAHMNGTPTRDCYEYVRAADGMSTADGLLAKLAPGKPLFRTYWRLWWTAAPRLGRPAQIAHVSDDRLPPEEAKYSLDQLCDLAYAYHYGVTELVGTGWTPGYVAFIDCEGCQNWRADRRLQS